MLNQGLNRNPLGGSTRAAVVVMLLVTSAAIAAAQNTYQTFSGWIVDATGLPIPRATVALADSRRQAKYEVKTNDAGMFEFIGLPSGKYAVDLQANVSGFAPLKETVALDGSNPRRRFALRIGSIQETINVQFSPGPAPAGSSDDRPSSPVEREVPMPPPSGCVATATGGRIVPPKKIKDVAPQYPPQLRGTDTEGTVVMMAKIGPDGYVNDVQPVGSPHPDLANAAMAAVREWRFTQTLLNCTPVEVTMTVTTTFKPMPAPVTGPPKP